MEVLTKEIGLQLVNNQYQIQGVGLEQLTRQFGHPLYVYDGAQIEHQYKQMVKAFEGLNCKVKYPTKALSNLNVLKLLKKLGSGLDTVSIQEVQLGLKAGFAPDEIIFTPNCVSLEEIEQAISFGVKINIDNIWFKFLFCFFCMKLIDDSTSKYYIRLVWEISSFLENAEFDCFI